MSVTVLPVPTFLAVPATPPTLAKTPVADTVNASPATMPVKLAPLTLTVAASVPALVYALGRATHDRKEIAARAEHLPTQDALTGLLTPGAFQSHLEDAYQRAISGREPVALVLVTVVNHEHIRSSMGDPIAEQCLLRAVIKLHRVLRDVDPAARVGSARFAMLMEGVASARDIDKALKLGLNHPMGPFELLDVVGLDVSLAIQRTLYLEFREPGFAPAPRLEHLATAGYLGRKTGRGVYTY